MSEYPPKQNEPLATAKAVSSQHEPSRGDEDKKSTGRSRVMTSLRNIVLWVAMASGLSGFNAGRVVDDIWPNEQPRPTATSTQQAGQRQDRQGRAMRYLRDELISTVDDVADGRISLEEATDEIVAILREVAPTSDEVRSQIKAILEKAQKAGTRRAWSLALQEILNLLPVLLQTNPTPTPTPAATMMPK